MIGLILGFLGFLGDLQSTKAMESDRFHSVPGRTDYCDHRSAPALRTRFLRIGYALKAITERVDRNCWSRRGRFTAEGRTRTAIELLETADDALQTSRLWALVAHFHYLLQEYDSATIAAQRALESDPGNRLALQTAGELKLRGSNFEQAEVYFQGSDRRRFNVCSSFSSSGIYLHESTFFSIVQWIF